jgi:long-chain acyl-CoA synthetase
VEALVSNKTVVEELLDRAEEKPRKPALWSETSGRWQALSWGEYARKCKLFAGALRNLGLEPNDKVAISGTNSASWVISDMGAMMARCVPLGIYKTDSPDEFAYVANHSDARVLAVQNKQHWAKFDEKRDELEDIERVVVFDNADDIDDDLVISFEDFLETGKDHVEQIEEEIDELEMDELATLIYTSGTTGDPKGVMLSHRNLSFTAQSARKALGDVYEDDCVVSYLPLSHIAEQMFTIHLAVTFGYPAWFCRDISKIKDVLEVARPTIFFGVPRVWQKFRTALENKFDEASGLKRKIIDWAKPVLAEANQKQIDQKQLPFFLSLQYKLAKKFFGDKLKGQLGFDRLRVALSAAAPISIDTLEFFLSTDIVIREIYGQSEDSGPATLNYPEPGKTKLGTVGLPLPGVDVRIADDGEILVRGDNVFMGYYKDEEETKETLRDDWLYTGDIGEFDDDGYLKITDRKKNIIITEGGKNVSPVSIEQKLTEIEGVGEAVAIGDERKYITALLTVDSEKTSKIAGKFDTEDDPEKIANNETFREHLDEGVEEVNEKLARVKTVKKYKLLPQDFSQETGELTPTKKIKRRVIRDKYDDEIEQMYS